MGRNDGRDVFMAAFGAGWGVWQFFHGFRKLKLKRTIEGLATSKVRSMAMGTVELSGVARCASQILDPIYQQLCALYKVVVQEYRRSGKSGSWHTIYERDSCAQPFF